MFSKRYFLRFMFVYEYTEKGKSGQNPSGHGKNPRKGGGVNLKNHSRFRGLNGRISLGRAVVFHGEVSCSMYCQISCYFVVLCMWFTSSGSYVIWAAAWTFIHVKYMHLY